MSAERPGGWEAAQAHLRVYGELLMPGFTLADYNAGSRVAVEALDARSELRLRIMLRAFESEHEGRHWFYPHPFCPECRGGTIDLLGRTTDEGEKRAAASLAQWLILNPGRTPRDTWDGTVPEAGSGGLDALFLDRDALASVKAPPMLIDGVLPAGSNAILRGRDGTFKTFLALDWSLHIATGLPWHGRAVERGRVLYVAGEGAFGLGKRVEAWEEEHGEPVDPEMFVVRRAALNLHRPGPDFDHLLRRIEIDGYRLVNIDTLRRVAGAADGNSSDMGAVVDNIDRIKRATGSGSTLTTAHTDKSDGDTRGYSGIEDDIDCVWHVKRSEGSTQVTARHTKMKDAPELPPVTLDAVSVRLPCEHDFCTDPGCTSLVLREPGRIESGKSPEWQILEWVAHGTDATEVTSAAIATGTKMPKTTVNRWLKKLVAKEQLENVGKPDKPRYRLPLP